MWDKVKRDVYLYLFFILAQGFLSLMYSFFTNWNTTGREIFSNPVTYLIIAVFIPIPVSLIKALHNIDTQDKTKEDERFNALLGTLAAMTQELKKDRENKKQKR